MRHKTDNDRKTFHSSLFLAAVRFGVFLLAECLLAELLLWVLPLILPIFIPISGRKVLLPAAAVCFAAAYTACRYTTVRIRDGLVEVKNAGKRHFYSCEDCDFFSESQKSTGLSVFSPLYQYSLIVNHKDGRQEKLRLWCFRADDCDKLIQDIDTIQMQRHNQAAADAKTFYELHFGEGELQIDRKRITANAWKNVFRISVIWVVISAVLIVLTLTDNAWEYGGSFRTLAEIVMSLCCVAYIPFSIVKTKRNAATCPSKLSFSGEHFMVDADHYSAAHIQNVSMTSVKLESHSIYPVPRYLMVKTDAGIHRYWLGSQDSMTCSEYMQIVQFVNGAFLPYPGIFCVSSRRGLLNR